MEMRSAEVKYYKLSVLQAFFKGLRERQASQNEPKKRTVLAVCYRCNFCPVGLRILSTTEFKLGKCFSYARLFSILKYNFCPIHFSLNLIAMFVSEMRETRCPYAGAMSEISGHASLFDQSITQKAESIEVSLFNLLQVFLSWRS